jgi:cyclase
MYWRDIGMTTKRIIPCLDTTLDEKGKATVVKGIKFEALRYAGDPVKLAKKYDEQGADEIAFLDITASYEKRPTIIETVKKVAEQISVPLCVGGGIGGLEDFRKVLDSGAEKVSVNTAAVKNPQLIRDATQTFGQVVVVAIDCKRKFSDLQGKTLIELEEAQQKAWYDVVIYGGRQTTGLDAVSWAKKAEELGAKEILLTSKDRDGTKDGYDLPITRTISETVNIPVIASGGVGNVEHMYQAFTKGKADACLAASIFHFNEYTIHEVKEYLNEKGIPMKMQQ